METTTQCRCGARGCDYGGKFHDDHVLTMDQFLWFEAHISMGQIDYCTFVIFHMEQDVCSCGEVHR